MSEKPLTLLSTSLGKKVVMALSGLVLFGFAIGHCIGNLQIFMGPQVLNKYAASLKDMALVVWVVRLALLGALLAHITTAIQLTRQSAAARPVKYKVKPPEIASSYASKTMMLSGPLLLLFVLYHLAHFTFPGVSFGTYTHSSHNVYANVVNGFSVPWVSSLYIGAQIVLGVHLYHGAWSLLQSLGINHPAKNENMRNVARTIAMALMIGNITIPLGVVFGVID